MNKRGLADNNKLFWIVMVVVLVMSTGTFLLTSPTITGGVAIQTISFIQEGNQLHFEVRNVENVKEADIQILKDTKGGKIIFEDITPPKFNGEVLSAFKGSSDKEKNFGQIKFLLKIKESDLGSISITDLRLYRDGKELVTDAGKRENGYVEYTARSPGLGLFIIGLENSQPIIDDGPKQGLPDLEPVVQQPQPVKKGFFERIGDFFKRFLG